MRLFHVFISSLAMGLSVMPALAQDKPGQDKPSQEAPEGGPRPRREGQMPPQLPLEKATAAWEVEAKNVARSLGLSADQTKQVVATYGDARKSHYDAAAKLRQDMADKMKEARESGKSPDEMREAMDDIQKQREQLVETQRTKLKTELSKTLTGDQLTNAMTPLGTFNPNWDTMVDAIIGFKLDEAKNNDSLSAIEKYVVVISKPRSVDDPQANRAANQEARKKLLDTVKPLLSDEQLGTFQRTLTGGGRGPGGRPGGEGAPGNPGAPGGGRGRDRTGEHNPANGTGNNGGGSKPR